MAPNRKRLKVGKQKLQEESEPVHPCKNVCLYENNIPRHAGNTNVGEAVVKALSLDGSRGYNQDGNTSLSLEALRQSPRIRGPKNRAPKVGLCL